MMNLMRLGGYSMWIVLLFGIILLVATILFVRRPEEGKLGFIRGMTVANIFAILSGIAGNLAATFNHAGFQTEANTVEAAASAMVGFSESLSPASLGFSVLAIAWLITAVGIRRLAMPGNGNA